MDLRSDVSGQRHGGGSPDQGRRVRKGLEERRPFPVVRARPQEADQGGGDDLVTTLLLKIGEHLRQSHPLPLPGGVHESRLPQHRRLVIPRTPRANEVVRPRGVLVRVAQVAGVGGLVGDRRRRRRRQHGVVAAPHPGEFGHGHVARDATARLALRRVPAVGGNVPHPLLVARETRLVGVLGLPESIPAAGGVAVHAA